MGLAVALYVIVYFTYGKFLEKKVIGATDKAEVPSSRFNDGVDFVPTRKFVLFGHHFASIAGAAPIVGPAIAMAYGWLPGLLWVWLGNMFLGATHDYFSLSASVRYDGKSIQYISSRLLGKFTGASFAWFILFLCVLVVAAFAAIVGGLFVKVPGAASAFLFMILAALVLGFLLYRTKLSFGLSTLIGIVMLFAAIFLGNAFPIRFSYSAWMVIFFFYIIIAASIPVTVLLQPRDYLNSFLLYLGLLLGGIAAFLSIKAFTAPAFTVFAPLIIKGQSTPFWPAIPLIIACGSLSGFHSLVASGTSSKQLASEKDGLFIGYGAMFTEGILSTLAIISIAAFGISVLGEMNLPQLKQTLSGSWSQYTSVINSSKIGGAANMFIISFSSMVSSALPVTFQFVKILTAMWVASFAMTTLDTTNRLARYVVSELAEPLKNISQPLHRIFTNKWIASVIPAFLGILLAWTGSWVVLWPAFSSANQLLASITMITISAWIYKKLNKKHMPIALIPGIFFWISVSAAMVWYLLKVVPVYVKTDPVQGYIVSGIMIIMLILNCMLMVSFIKNFRKKEME